MLADLEEIAAQRNISFERINVGELIDEINKRARLLEGRSGRADDVWPPLRHPVLLKLFRELIEQSAPDSCTHTLEIMTVCL